MSSLVLREVLQRGVVKLTMNNPSKFNVLSGMMMQSLSEQLRDISQCEETRCVVLTGAGKAFCTGHDIQEMMSFSPEKDTYTELFNTCSDLMMLVRKLPQPVVARVDGVATAAGCQLVAMCDMAVSSSSSKFATSGINYGLFCSTPAVAVSRSMHSKQAFEMLVMGDFVTADQAVQLGLINKAVNGDELDNEVLRISSKIALQPLHAIRDGKSLFYRQLGLPIKTAYEIAGDEMASKMCKSEAREGFQAFLEKRQPPWRLPP